MFRALFFVALASSGSIAQAAQIELSASASGPVAWSSATVRDRWPEGCAPRADGVSTQGHAVTLTAVLPDPSCLDQARATTEEVETTLRFDLPNLWSGTYQLRYEVRPAPKVDAELHGFRLAELGIGAANRIRPETGLWWPEQGGLYDRAGPGLGLLMETQANTLSLTVLGYAAQGAAEWSYGASAVSGRLLDIELATLSEGRGPFVSYSAPKRLDPAGSVQVELHSAARATLWFLRPTGTGRALAVEPISMVRFSFGQTVPEAWIGRWVIAPEAGNGIASRYIDFSRLEMTGQGFTLHDERDGYRLACVTARTRRNSPPQFCDLIAADGSREIRFDQPALFELRGRTLVGDAMTALKLNR